MNRQRIILGAFLIFGTILALFLAVEFGIDIFYQNTIWMEREGLKGKAIFVGTFTDFVLLLLAGGISIISFFRNGQLWKPITKGIIINILIWLLIIASLFLETILWGALYGSLVMGVIILCMYALWKLNKVIG